MAGPDLAADAAEHLAPAYPGAYESALAAAILAPLQRMADVILDDDGAYASVFARTITDPTPLAWGAQWAGVRAELATEDQLRDGDYVRSRWRRGTLPAITAAIQSVLTGTKNVRIYEDRYPADFSVFEAYHISVVTTTAETPGGADSIIEALTGANRVLPALLNLHVAVVDGYSWQDVLDGVATWQDVLDDYDDWQHIYAGDPI